jgi:hypothetical protein
MPQSPAELDRHRWCITRPTLAGGTPALNMSTRKRRAACTMWPWPGCSP